MPADREWPDAAAVGAAASVLSASLRRHFPAVVDVELALARRMLVAAIEGSGHDRLIRASAVRAWIAEQYVGAEGERLLDDLERLLDDLAGGDDAR